LDKLNLSRVMGTDTFLFVLDLLPTKSLHYAYNRYNKKAGSNFSSCSSRPWDCLL